LSPEAADIIAQIHNRLAQKLGPQRYRIWIKNSTHFTLANGHLRIDVPNPFVGRWIENNFQDAINDAVFEVTQRNIEIAYSIDASLTGRLRKSQLDSQAEYVAKNPERMARSWARLPAPPRPKCLRGRLEDFVVGDCNRLAFTAAKSIAEQNGPRFNPLCIFGGCGLGKTHLLHGIANALEANSNIDCLYVSGEEFTNHFVHAVKSNRTSAFRARYRSLDVLLIDDVHFLANKKATQEEFLHTFNAIDAVGKQVVMTSDTHPKLIGQLSDSLVTRFLSGMVVEIEKPGRETCEKILRNKAAAMNRHVPEEVVEMLASRLAETNVRELEGALLKLIALCEVTKHPLDLGLTRRVLDQDLRRTRPLVRFTDIESLGGSYFGVTPAELRSSRRTRTVALARNIVMHLARKHTNLSSTEVGRLMGKDHTTVLLACQKMAAKLRDDETVIWNTPDGSVTRPIRNILSELEGQLRNGALGATG
jgi:chromosomal replication initiator protein